MHAGLLPEWTIHRALGGKRWSTNWPGAITALSGPPVWQQNPPAGATRLKGIDRLRLVVNVMTRMRLLTLDGELDLSFKGELADDAPPQLQALV